MTSLKILALVLMLGGGLGLAYGSFSYTQETHEAKIGALELSVKDKQTVNVPQWLSVAAIGAGLLLLILDRKQS